MVIAPNARKRIAVSARRGIAFEGNPGSIRVEYASGAAPAEVEQADGVFDLPLVTVPDLLTVRWDVDGIEVSADVEAVAARYCTVEDVRGYQPEQNLLGDVDDETVQGAIDRAEAVIEREAHRVFQPVLLRGVTDRPNCRASSMVLVGDGTASDITAVVSAKDQDGNAVSMRPCGQCLLDVRDLGLNKFAEVVVECGMNPTPPEMKTAVVALAAWYLTPHATPDNATSTSTDLGFMRFVVGGVDGAATSIPEVNALIGRYGLMDYKVR